jgi:hypothetical protein
LGTHAVAAQNVMSTTETSGAPAVATATAPAPAHHERRTRRRAVIASLLSCFVFIGSAIILYLPWVRYDNPTAMIVVQADAAVQDFTIRIDYAPPAAGEPLKAPLKDAANDQLRFHVPPGRYKVTLIDDRGNVRGSGELHVDAGQAKYVSLARLMPATTPH